MADNLWNSRFIQAGRTPAWHLKGWLLGDEKIDARTAAGRVAGDHRVSKVPLVARTIDGTWEIGVDYAIIVREPTSDDPRRRVFGRPVSKDYELIDVQRAAEITDRAWGNTFETIETPIETFGVLGKGEEIFITARVRSFAVRGDEMAMFEYLYSPMYSDKAAVCGLTPVRIVCANTLTTGIAKSTQKFYIDHLPGASAKMEAHMRSIHENQIMVAETIQEAFEILADARIKTDKQRDALVEQIYTAPPKPQPEWDMQFGIPYEKHLELYEEKMGAVNVVRKTIVNLYEGDGTAMDTVAVNHTKFGLYNAVAEYETFRRGPHDRAAVSLVAGDRASTIRKAFDVLTGKPSLN